MPQQAATNRTNRDFVDHETAPDDLIHDGKLLRARDLETAALF